MLRSGYYLVGSYVPFPDCISDEWYDEWCIAKNVNVPTVEHGDQYFGYGCEYNILTYKEYDECYEDIILMDDSIVGRINKEDAIIIDNLSLGNIRR